jgi:hypothetical protein
MKSIVEPVHGNYFDGSSGMFHGMHFSDIVITGTFESRVDAASILAYANACLNPSDKDKYMVCVKCGVYTKKCYPTTLCLNCYTVKLQSVVSKAKQAGINPPKPFLLPKKETTQPMFNGEIRKLPKANSPLWTEQWAAQGSAKSPYIVSHKKGFNGSTTDEGWACSCKDFTSHTPRADCKHICWVKKAEGITTAPPIAALPKDQQEAFKQFLLQQAQKGNPVDKIDKPKPFVTQGRRFR